MAGPISQRFIDDLLARVDVAEIVGERVTLKKAGRNLSGLCPFHDEKSPSFTVSRDKQFYHCFGCGAHGNALRFLMEYDRLSFPEAVEQLASRQGLEVEREDDRLPAHERQRREAQRKKQDEGVNLLELSADWFRQQLAGAPAEAGRGYLKGRGLDKHVMEAFGIGFAPDGWDGLKSYLSQQGVSEAVQVEYGLLVQREDSQRTYDRFRNRVMFPIRDFKGRTLGFGGRVLGDAKPKYLNSPETPVFHKGRELYGLYEARMSEARIERLLVVEGYMDVVALAQNGISNAVATLGTAITEDHLKRIYRLVDEVVFCFDGDGAGRRAARRALEVALPSMIDGRQARFLFLPEGEDPDSVVRSEGSEAFNARVECASPLSEFLFEQAREGLDLKRVEGRERFVAHVLEKLALLPQGVLRSLLMEELSKRSGIATETLQQFAQSKGNAGYSGQAVQNAQVADYHPVDGDTSDEMNTPIGMVQSRRPKGGGQAVTRVLHLLVHAPELGEQVTEAEQWCPDDADGRILKQLLRFLKAGRYSSPNTVFSHFRGTDVGFRLEALWRQELLLSGEDRQIELHANIKHLQTLKTKASPKEELAQLMAKDRSGVKLTHEERQRVNELLRR